MSTYIRDQLYICFDVGAEAFNQRLSADRGVKQWLPGYLIQAQWYSKLETMPQAFGRTLTVKL